MEGTYLVTGAGSGIGRATAQALGSRGARLILVGRTFTKLEATRSSLMQPDDHQVVVVDVRNGPGLGEKLAELDLAEGMAGAVLAAGVGGPNAYGPEDRWEEVLEINLSGAYRSAQEALPYLRKAQGFRHLLFVSSVLARLGVPGYSAYCAAKAGLLGLTRSLAAELAPEQILVNALCPGWVDTDMATDGLKLFAKAAGVSLKEARERQLSVVPLGRMSTPAEIAETAVFLMDGRQTSITGAALDINNGAVMAP